MSRVAKLFALSLGCLMLVLSLVGCGGDDGGPGVGTIVINMEPDDCPLEWTLTGPGVSIEGTGDRRLANLPAGVEYLVRISHEPGWAGSGTLDERFHLQSGKVHEAGFDFVPLVLGAFIEVAAGTFTMGSPVEQAGSDEDERPQHEVTFTRPLLVKATEVTQHEYLAITSELPSSHRSCDDCPVERVDFSDAVNFCNLLSEWAGLQPAYSVLQDTVRCDWNANGYRLPTESEWEYACRAGTTTRYSFGDDAADLGDYGWYGDNADDQTHPVGELMPNAWGLYDMHGNVFEMTWDGYRSYPEEPVTDPVREPHNENRMCRGGDYHWDWSWATSTWRGTYTPFEKIPNLGFRVVRDAAGGKDMAGTSANDRPGRTAAGNKPIGQ